MLVRLCGHASMYSSLSLGYVAHPHTHTQNAYIWTHTQPHEHAHNTDIHAHRQICAQKYVRVCISHAHSRCRCV